MQLIILSNGRRAWIVCSYAITVLNNGTKSEKIDFVYEGPYARWSCTQCVAETANIFPFFEVW